MAINRFAKYLGWVIIAGLVIGFFIDASLLSLEQHIGSFLCGGVLSSIPRDYAPTTTNAVGWVLIGGAIATVFLAWPDSGAYLWAIAPTTFFLLVGGFWLAGLPLSGDGP